MSGASARLAAAAVGAGLLLAACHGDTYLEGSLSELFPLDVSRVEVARNSEAFQVTYFDNRDLFIDVVARVSVYVGDVDPDGGWRRPISLVGPPTAGCCAAWWPTPPAASRCACCPR